MKKLLLIPMMLTCLISYSQTNWYINDVMDGNEVYCIAEGSGTNSGISTDSPYPSLALLLQDKDIEPGDRIIIDAGTYSDEATFGLDDVGTSSEGILVEGIDSSLVKFVGGQFSSITVPEGVSNILIKNISIKNTFNYPCLISNGDSITISACSFNTNDDAIEITSSYITVMNCQISSTKDGLYITNSNNLTIINNTFYNFDNSNSSGLYAFNVDSCYIESNYFIGLKGPNSDYGIIFQTVTNSTIANNYIVDYQTGLFTKINSDNISIMHNTIHCHTNAFYAQRVDNYFVRNNIFYTSSTSDPAVFIDSTDNLYSIDYNLYYGSKLIGTSLAGEFNSGELNQFFYNHSQEQNGKEGDPMFEFSGDSPDILQTSPAVGSGEFLDWLTTDIYGNSRNNPPSIGAHEMAAIPTDPRAYYVNDGFTDDDVFCTAKGDDDIADGSKDKPYAHVNYLMSSVDLNPGDSVIIDVGLYNEGINVGGNDSGNVILPIYFIGASKKKTIFNLSSGLPVNIDYGINYLVFENLTFVGNEHDAPAVNIYGGNNTFHDCDIISTSFKAVYIYLSNNNEISNCVLSAATYCVYADECMDLTLKENYFITGGHQENGITIHIQNSTVCDISGNQIYGSEIADSIGGIAIELNNTSEANINNNFIARFDKGISVENNSAGANFYYNTIKANKNAVYADSLPAWDIRNNIFYSEDASEVTFKILGDLNGVGILDYNLYYGPDTIVALVSLGKNYTKNDVQNFVDLFGFEQNGIAADPEFTYSDSANMLIESYSPANNAGDWIDGIDYDFAKQLREYPPTIGAFEIIDSVYSDGVALYIEQGETIDVCPDEETELSMMLEFMDYRNEQWYDVVQIGGRYIMAENLNFNPEVGTAKYYADDSVSFSDRLGLLYDHDAAFQACPEDWHLPDTTEWNTLIDNVGGTDIAGQILKQRGDTEWLPSDEDVAGDDKYLFEAIGGEYHNGTEYAEIASKGMWWSSDIYGNSVAYGVQMMYDQKNTEMNLFALSNKLSVRCISNDTESYINYYWLDEDMETVLATSPVFEYKPSVSKKLFAVAEFIENIDTNYYLDSIIINVNSDFKASKITSVGGNIIDLESTNAYTADALPLGNPNEYEWAVSCGTKGIETSLSVTIQWTDTCSDAKVILTEEDTYGCKQEIVYDLQVVLPDESCESSFSTTKSGNEVTFSNSSTGNNLEYFWEFDDGAVSNEVTPPPHLYTNQGIYRICLTVIDITGECQNKSCKEVIVGTALCKADFNYVINDLNVVEFENASTGSSLEYYWTFDDMNFSTDSMPVHQYTFAGVYEVCLNIKDTDSDCQDSECRYLFIGENACKASFEFFADVATNKVYFEDNSVGEIDEWYWDFGDGTFASDSVVNHTYNNSGSYDVCLHTYDNATGCISDVCQEVFIGQDVCKADFELFIDTANMSVELYNHSSGASSLYYWTLGDGDYSTDTNLVHQYTTGGVYKVCLSTTDTVNDCFSKECKEVVIGDDFCKADFEYFVDQDLNKVTFESTSDGEVSKFYWDLGDGTTESTANVVHVYEAGNHEVSLSVSGSSVSCKDQISKEIIIEGVDCQARFEYYVDSSDNTVSLVNTSIGDNSSYYWSFGDGEFNISENPEHSYVSAGNYNVCLTVRNGLGGCMDVACEEIQVGTIECNAYFEYFIEKGENTVEFTPEIKGEATLYYWEFGDGDLSLLQTPIHKYTAPGYYNVVLNVYNALNGCMDIYEEVLLIDSAGIDCQADFIYQSINDSIYFVNKSIGKNITFYHWDFNDGQISDVENPVIQFGEKKVYQVCLSVYDTDNNCGNTNCQFVVNISTDNIFSDITLAEFIYCTDSSSNTVFFNDQSTGNNNDYLWLFGDGVESTMQNPEHIFTDTGFYVVTLYVQNSTTGIYSSFVDLINVGGGNTGIRGKFVYNLDSINSKSGNIPVDFSGAIFGDPATFEWDFGDGTSDSTSINPTHSYADTGIYTVCFTVEDPVTGQEDTYCDEVVVETEATGIYNADIINFRVVPNPANDIVSFYTSTYGEFFIDILNINGALAYSGIMPQKLNIADYTAGVYFIKLYNTDHSVLINHKLIIQH